MQTSPRDFATQFVSVVIASLAPVILVAFTSIPFNLGGHPGEQRDHIGTEQMLQEHAVQSTVSTADSHLT